VMHKIDVGIYAHKIAPIKFYNPLIATICSIKHNFKIFSSELIEQILFSSQLNRQLLFQKAIWHKPTNGFISGQIDHGYGHFWKNLLSSNGSIHIKPDRKGCHDAKELLRKVVNKYLFKHIFSYSLRSLNQSVMDFSLVSSSGGGLNTLRSTP